MGEIALLLGTIKFFYFILFYFVTLFFLGANGLCNRIITWVCQYVHPRYLADNAKLSPVMYDTTTLPRIPQPLPLIHATLPTTSSTHRQPIE